MERVARDNLTAKETPSESDIVASAEAMIASFRQKVGEHEPGPWPESAYTWIVPYFKFFCYPDPLAVQIMADDLGLVRQSIKSGQVTAVQGLTPQIEDWEGKARDSFYENFLVPFPDAVENQTEVIDELRIALWAYESILRAARVDAKKLLDETKKVVDAYDGDKSGKTQFAFTIIAAFAGVVKDLPRGGATLGLALVGNTATLGKGAQTAATDIGGKTVADIMNSFIAAAEEIRPMMDDQEQKLAAELDKSNATVDGILNNSDPKTLMQLLPNEVGTDGARITDRAPGDAPEFRPPYV